MRKPLVAAVLLAAALAVPFAPLAQASTDGPEASPAVILVAEPDLPALLASGALADYALVRADEGGTAALGGLGLGEEHALLTPGQIGLDTPNFYYYGFYPYYYPFYYSYYPFYYPYFYSFYPVYSYYPFFAKRVFVYRPFVLFPRFTGRVTVIVY
jgi:hypothetical protein